MNDAQKELFSKLESPSYTADDYEVMAEAASEISYLAKRVEALERAAPPSQAEKRGEEADGPAITADVHRDAALWRTFKSLAHHSYNQKVVSNAQSASLMKEHFITVHAASWDELETHIEAALAKSAEGKKS